MAVGNQGSLFFLGTQDVPVAQGRLTVSRQRPTSRDRLDLASPGPGSQERGGLGGQGPSDFTNRKYHCWGALWASSACFRPSVW